MVTLYWCQITPQGADFADLRKDMRVQAAGVISHAIT